MAIRKAIANKLSKLAKSVEQDRSKENTAAAIKDGRRKLANWIAPKEPGIYRVNVSVIG
jgi:hypothetical protein